MCVPCIYIKYREPLCCWWLICPIQNDANILKMTETLACGYSSESARWELSNEYQHGWDEMVFKDFCVLVFWMKVDLASEGLKENSMEPWLLLISGLKVSASCMLLPHPRVQEEVLSYSHCTLLMATATQSLPGGYFLLIIYHLADFLSLFAGDHPCSLLLFPGFSVWASVLGPYPRV